MYLVHSWSSDVSVVLVNGREYETDVIYASDGLAQENSAMIVWRACYLFSANRGMAVHDGAIHGLPSAKRQQLVY
jgi:hypothetical protein